MVGEMVMPYFIYYVGPEIAVNMIKRLQSRASHSLDLFGFGRTMQETLLGGKESEFFPTSSPDIPNNYKENMDILIHGTGPLFKADSIGDDSIIAILKCLLNRDPSCRSSLKRVRQYLDGQFKSPFAQAEDDTTDSTATLYGGLTVERKGKFDPAALRIVFFHALYNIIRGEASFCRTISIGNQSWTWGRRTGLACYGY